MVAEAESSKMNLIGSIRPRRLLSYWPYLLIAVVYLIAVVPAPGRPIPGATFDDGLFYKLSGHLLDGQWLGSWDVLTLAKGPLHSILSAAAFKVGLPLYAYKRLLYLIAALFFVVVGMPRQRQWIRYLTLVALLGDPFLFGEGGLRNLREGTYIPLQLIAFALALSVIDKVMGVKKITRSILIAALSTAFCFGLLAITREARMLLLIEVLAWLVLIVCICVSRDSKSSPSFSSARKTVQLLLSLSLVLLFFQLPIVSLRFVNNLFYSAPISTSIEEGQLPRLYGRLASIRLAGEEPIPRVAITNRSLLALRNAPQAKDSTIKTIIDNLDPAWKSMICKQHSETCNEYGGGFLMWALRMSIGSLLPPGSNESDFQSMAALATHDLEDVCKQNKSFVCDSGSLGYFPRPDRWGFKDPVSEFINELRPILITTLIPSLAPQGIPNFYAYNEWPPAEFKKLRLNNLGSRRISLHESFKWTKPAIISRYLGYASKWLLLVLSAIGFLLLLYSCLSAHSSWTNLLSLFADPGLLWLLLCLMSHLLVYALLGLLSFSGMLYLTMASPIYIVFLARSLSLYWPSSAQRFSSAIFD